MPASFKLLKLIENTFYVRDHCHLRVVISGRCVGNRNPTQLLCWIEFLKKIWYFYFCFEFWSIKFWNHFQIKCHEYYPSKEASCPSTSLTFENGYKVDLISEESTKHFVKRKLELREPKVFWFQFFSLLPQLGIYSFLARKNANCFPLPVYILAWFWRASGYERFLRIPSWSSPMRVFRSFQVWSHCNSLFCWNWSLRNFRRGRFCVDYRKIEMFY